jgi:hypothetical protein
MPRVGSIAASSKAFLRPARPGPGSVRREVFLGPDASNPLSPDSQGCLPRAHQDRRRSDPLSLMVRLWRVFFWCGSAVRHSTRHDHDPQRFLCAVIAGALRQCVFAGLCLGAFGAVRQCGLAVEYPASPENRLMGRLVNRLRFRDFCAITLNVDSPFAGRDSGHVRREWNSSTEPETSLLLLAVNTR